MADRQNNKRKDAFDSEELKRYLFFETGETERGRLEERFFDDDELFYELLDLENDLTDRYARNELGENDQRRFESSLAKSPERRAKLANAETLQTFIKEETNLVATVKFEEESPNFWERTASFFGLNAAKFQYATAALLFLLLVGIGFLIYERRRDELELARLRENETGRTAGLQRQEQTLEEQIKAVQERERNLQTELAEKSGQTEILTEQLEREQAEKIKLERELENLKRQKQMPVPPSAPTMATIILSPIGGKGGGGASVVAVSQNTSKISATLQIPKDSAAETFSVRLDSVPFAENLKPSLTKSGNKFIRIVFPAKDLSSEKETLISVSGSDGSRYNYVLQRQK